MPYPNLPLEFVVNGTPVSLQSSSKGRQSWKERVRAGGSAAIPMDALQLTCPISVTIYYFPEGEMEGDIDNIVKPILDAMNKLIYDDDHQVERVVVQRFAEDNFYDFPNPSSALVGAMISAGPAVYIRVTDDIHGDLR